MENKEQKLIAEIADIFPETNSFQIGITKAQKIIALVREHDGWVSVGKELPDFNGSVDVLVMSTENKKYQRRVTDIGYSEERGFDFHQRLHPAEYVAYWMFKPAPPTTEKE